MMQELSKSEPVCGRYGPLKIMDGWKNFIQMLDRKKKKDEKPRWSIYIQNMDETHFTWMNPISSKNLNDNPPFGWKLEKNS